MKPARILRSFLAVTLFGSSVVACYAEASAPSEECRTVEVRNRHDAEVCTTRCGDEGCREHCHERERWSREHRCWVD